MPGAGGTVRRSVWLEQRRREGGVESRERMGRSCKAISMNLASTWRAMGALQVSEQRSARI